MNIPERAGVSFFTCSTPFCFGVYDYEICDTEERLQQVLDSINQNRYEMVGVTQDGSGTYTVFFRRPAHG